MSLLTTIKTVYREEKQIRGGTLTPIGFAGYAATIFVHRVLYGADRSNYEKLNFKNKGFFEKFTYLTHTFEYKFAYEVDDINEIRKYGQKPAMYAAIKDYIGREQLFVPGATRDDFKSFVSRHPVFIYKPDDMDGGHGVKRYEIVGSDVDSLYEEISKTHCVIDEPVIQNEALDRLCDKSVNTIRIVTLRIGNDIHFIAAALRMGNGSACVDNFSSGGIVSCVDLNTGIVVGDGEDLQGNKYPKHPYSGITLKGYQLPHWDKAIALVESAAQQFPINYVGWDVAIRKDDCVFIEANPHCQINAIQLGGAGGRKKQYKKLLKEWRKANN